MEEPTLKGRNQRKVLALSPTLFSDDGPWAKGATILFLSSIVPIRTSGLVRFVLLSTQFSVFVRDHVRRKVVACLPSHPLEKLVARKKRRGSEAVLPASFIPTASFASVRSSPPFSKPDWSASENVQSGAARCLADPLIPIRVGLTQNEIKVYEKVSEVSMVFYLCLRSPGPQWKAPSLSLVYIYS
ncbi:hypothetical protein GQ457_06G024650 [Hibiscus cannabinus]